MIVLMARCTASTNVVSPGAAWAVSDARPAKKLATAVPAAPGGVRGDPEPEPLLDCLDRQRDHRRALCGRSQPGAAGDGSRHAAHRGVRGRGRAERPAGRGGFATAIALCPSEARDAN